MILRTVVLMFCVAITGAGVVAAQTFPAKSMRIVVGGTGGGSDFAARLIAQGLTVSLGQQVIVDNRGITAAEIVAHAPPDGHTLLSYGSPLWLTQFLREQVRWDPLKDFSPVTLAVSAPNMVVVHPGLPVKTVRDLITLAKARPGEINYASSTTGSSTHIAAELFKAMADVNILRIPYKGNAPGLNALIGGQVQLMFPNAGAVTPHLKAGRLKALAVTTAQPSALAPGLPTVAASGLPGYESESIFGIFVPAKTSAVLINRLNQEILRVLNAAAVREKLFNSGMDVVGSSPEALSAAVRAEMTQLGKLIRDAGIREE